MEHSGGFHVEDCRQHTILSVYDSHDKVNAQHVNCGWLATKHMNYFLQRIDLREIPLHSYYVKFSVCITKSTLIKRHLFVDLKL